MGSFPGAGLIRRLRDARGGNLYSAPELPAWAHLPDGVGRHHRPIGAWVLHAPHTLRALVRTSELWLVVLAALIGVAAGLCVIAMTAAAQGMHHLLYNLPSGARLSGEGVLVPHWRALIPALGGLALGASGLILARFWPRRALDPIEANALYGGRMSLIDSLILVAQTILSNGAGASVGLEAGYAQIGSAVASRVGQMFRLRRADLRVLVGCGAAAAIGGAFNAPLTGAFYAFELVIGTYSLATLAPVVAAALTAVSVVRLLTPVYSGFDIVSPTTLPPAAVLPVIALAILCAFGGIAIMRGVTLTETIFRRSGVPVWARPAIGGLAVGGLALVTPAVLSSGHAALEIGIDLPYPITFLITVIVLKAAASAISIGSGFRGGLFFASLLLGAMLGKLFFACLALAGLGAALPPLVAAIVGMCALATAIVGGPLTMAFLSLETTGSFPLTVAVVGASVISALTVRRTFGYSFATWRFHLRGEAIRSAVDIGWMRSLTVGRMMRRDTRTARLSTPLATFRHDFPLGATSRVIVTDDDGCYAGIVLLAEAHADAGATRLGDLLRYTESVLTPEMSVKEAASMFEDAEADALAVVDAPDTRKVIGQLTEAHALRRYSEELDRHRRELSGE